ncbi:hypothetical protein GRX01_00070 [Halobaculum sp. WSA2]|uniref:Uncharacterized protein n=1 Tax=Halobaculum saliterrae TaxID=2073113 RepID=A0A6B0SZB3_9EURY|nr:hypothetical protein [Halobaculum saliterrae]MXR39759.1 hypothetical protein [Halobaculum saliterrae]
MNATKLLAVALASLLMSAGVGAAATSTGTGATVAATDASVDEYETDAAYDNGTATVTVTANGSGVEGLSMARNGSLVGTTDADGSVAFDVNASETGEVVLDVTGENVSGEIVLAFENDSVSVESAEFTAETTEEETNETDENETDRRGPQIGLPADASENAKAVVSAINAYMNGDTNASSLGEAVSSVAGNGADGERGPPADVGPDGDDENETDDRGPPEDVGPNGDDENETDDRGPPEDAGPNDDADDDEEDDDEEDDDEDDDDEDDGARGNNGNGNGNGR